MFLFIFIVKHIFPIDAMEIIYSKTYSSLLYELFKAAVPKLPNSGTGLNFTCVIVNLS